jgi:hypothetical protein
MYQKEGGLKGPPPENINNLYIESNLKTYKERGVPGGLTLEIVIHI